MKLWIHQLLLISISSLLLLSCKKDEVKTILKQGAAPVVTANATTLVLDQTNADKNAVTVNWSAADYGFQAATAYTVQFSKKGNNFAAATTVDVSALHSTSKTFTVGDLNKQLLKIIPAGNASDVEIRIKSDVGASGVAPVYSNILTIKATPYKSIIDYPSLYVPGDYQGWNPAKAPKISTVKNNKVYEGYVNITPGSLAFKLTSDPDWSHTNYGDNGSGKLSTSGGDLKVPSAGYYLLKADLNDLSWSATKTAWSIIGDATPGGWTNDTDMTFDATTGVWTLTANLTAGKLKFRANHSWDINFGDDDKDNAPDYAGADIVVSAAGNYTITLDLSVPGNYSYTLKKN